MLAGRDGSYKYINITLISNSNELSKKASQ